MNIVNLLNRDCLMMISVPIIIFLSKIRQIDHKLPSQVIYQQGLTYKRSILERMLELNGI